MAEYGSYYQQQQPQEPAPLAETVDINDFYKQPAPGSPAWSWKDKPIGTFYEGVVDGPATVRHATDPSGTPKYNWDGSPQVVMVVPMLMPKPDERHPHGVASWIVNARHRDELVRAMTVAGVPDTLIRRGPEIGAAIRVTLIERRPSKFGLPSNIVHVDYLRPTGAEPAAPQRETPVTATPAPNPEPTAVPARAETAAPQQETKEFSQEQQALLAKLASGAR